MTTFYNPFSLQDKQILVTGATSGIGRSIAIECSKLGAKLIVTGRNPDRMNDLLQNLYGFNHISVICDLSEHSGIESLLNNISKLDGIVLAAGIVEMMPIAFASKPKFEKIYNTNFFSPVEICRLIIKKKLLNPSSSIVAISSVAGSRGFSVANSIYGSGKAALISFMKYLAIEYAGKNIRVNTISPGLILTPMHTQGAVEKEELRRAVDKVPLKRWGLPEDVANAACFLLSNASDYITGIDICIDGGLTI